MRTVAIVGGGFSGLLTALHVIRADPGVRVRLIERAAPFARGRAYATANGDHLLNVRTGNMSAFPDQPDHFQAWLKAQPSDLLTDADGFVSRGVYGAYLQGRLREALADGKAPGRLMLEADEAVTMHRASGGGWSLTLGMGRRIAADVVVLAVGLLPPSAAPGATPELPNCPAYAADPWSFDPEAAPPGDVLLIGTGLTMVDIALSLSGRRRVLAISRRGLTPRSHAQAPPAPPPAGLLDTPRRALRTLRAHAAAFGWRSAVDSIRPLAQGLWGDWSLDERRRFLRHLRPWWDVHRHRTAPAIAGRLGAMLASGDLILAAGRIEALEPQADGSIRMRYRPRSRADRIEARFAAVVNCTGPHGDLDMARDRLLSDLRARGLIRADALRLGLDVDRALRVIGSDGAPTPGLFAVGPLTRAAFWESVSVPDIRIQAALAATSVLRMLAGAEPMLGDACSSRTTTPVVAAD